MQKPLIRILDILLSLLAIVAGLPLFLIVFIMGMLDSGSPLFLQVRVGKNQKLFTLVKFRTMSEDTQSVGTHLIDSDSITKLGGILRKTKLDELPQFFNVLLGQMSLVGPRPCLPNQTELIEERSKRGVFNVHPGITGLAQINEIDMSTPRKLARYDQIMIKSMSLRLYAKLIIATVLGKGHGDRVRTAPP
jgi:lipopolysaccharide/colanic/teichoic acid biosynthesis glycosyltransferase